MTRKFVGLLFYAATIVVASGNFFFMIWSYRTSLLAGQGIGSMAGMTLFLTLLISAPLWLLARWVSDVKTLTSTYWAGIAATVVLMTSVPVYF